jgi:hypothetical protein
MVDVRYWHKADIDFDAEYVRFQGQSGHRRGMVVWSLSG